MTTGTSPAPDGDGHRRDGGPGAERRGGGAKREAGDRPDLPAWLGWTLVALITIGVLATWAPSLTAALGDNHEGRILARHALNVANAQADGLAASGWLSDWSPYVGDGGEQTSYAHHPPLLNLGYYLAGQVLPVPLDVAMRTFAYLIGVAMLPVGAAVLRRLEVRWTPTVLATVAVAVTPLFWTYGRLHGNVTLLLLMVLAVVRVAEPRRIGRAELAAAAVASVVAIVAGYLGMATAALLGLWLLRTRGLDAGTITGGIARAVGAAISLGYVIGTTGAGRVGEQVQMRTGGGDFTAREFVERIAEWATTLLAWWWRWLLLPAALVAGVLHRPTRALTIVFGLVTIGYVVGLPNGSFIHDYWIFPVLLPVWTGVAALGSFAAARWPSAELLAGAGAVAVLLVLGAWHGFSHDVPARQFSEPEAAGELVRDVPPADGQSQAWRTGGIAAPRWHSYYWDLPPALVTADAVDDVPADELVLVRLDGRPGWLGDPEQVRDVAVETRGDFGLLTGDQLAQLAGAD